MSNKSLCPFSIVLLFVLTGHVSADDIVFDANSSGTADSSWSASWTHTIGGGQKRILVVGLGAEDSSTSQIEIDTIEYNGVAMNLVVGSSRLVGSGSPVVYYMKTDLYYLLENDLPASGGIPSPLLIPARLTGYAAVVFH